MEHYPVLKEKYILFQTQHADKLAKDPAHDLVYVYDGMLELLQRPDDDDIPMPPPTSRLQ